jgi:hypothetical protein
MPQQLRAIELMVSSRLETTIATGEPLVADSSSIIGAAPELWSAPVGAAPGPWSAPVRAGARRVSNTALSLPMV